MINLKVFGKKLKEIRIKNDMTLREVTKKTRYDSSNWSKIERGLLHPPSNEKTLNNWAKVLNLSDKERKEFIDEALAIQGKIPQDIYKNKEKAELLPAFFRTIRGEKPTKKEFETLKKRINEEQ